MPKGKTHDEDIEGVNWLLTGLIVLMILIALFAGAMWLLEAMNIVPPSTPTN